MKTVKTVSAIEKMNVSELKEVATSLNISFKSRITKKDLVALIKKAREAEFNSEEDHPIMEMAKAAAAETPESKKEAAQAKKEAAQAKKAAQAAKIEAKVTKKEVEQLKAKLEEKEEEKQSRQSASQKRKQDEVAAADAEKSADNIKRRKNLNRVAYKELKKNNHPITKAAFNPDTDYKVLLKEAKASAKSASTPKVDSKDKSSNKDTSKTKQNTTSDKPVKAPKYNRWDSAADAIKAKKNYKSIDDLAGKADALYVKKTGKNSNLKESKAVVQVAVKLVAHFDVVVKIEK
jgi:hypothetical protein